jgi:hypothetical protein
MKRRRSADAFHGPRGAAMRGREGGLLQIAENPRGGVVATSLAFYPMTQIANKKAGKSKRKEGGRAKHFLFHSH